MKRHRKILSVMLAVIMTMSVFTLCVSAQEAGYRKGDIVEYGTYPQSEVTDEELIKKLNSQHLHFENYSYWHYGEREDVDYSQYADVTVDGERYRAVEFSAYRDFSDFTTTDREYSNKYRINNRYWFKFEPLRWVVMDPETGFVVSEKLIDYQEYNNSDRNYYGYSGGMYDPVVSYYHSSVRHWLNEDFYQTAFTRKQKDNIKRTLIDNSNMEMCGDFYPSQNSEDKIFLLSFTESEEFMYNIVEDKEKLSIPTDYAWSQGLGTPDGIHSNGWVTRTGFPCHDNYVYGSHYYGDASLKDAMRPACILSEIRNDSSLCVASGRAGKEAFWSIDSDGVLSVGGNGEMGNMHDNYYERYRLWNSCRECDFEHLVNKAVIESGLTTVCHYAFSSLTGLKEIELPDTLEMIDAESGDSYGPYCFSGLPELEKIIVDPKNEKYFSDDGVLYGKIWDKSNISLICYPSSKTDKVFTVPAYVSYIHNHAFEGLRYAETVIIPENVSRMEYQPFLNTYCIKDIYIYNRNCYISMYCGDSTMPDTTIHSYSGSIAQEYAESREAKFLPFCEGVHYGGEASCSARAVCSDCGEEYGDLLPHTDSNGDRVCDVCSQKIKLDIGSDLLLKITEFFNRIRLFFEKLFG